MSVSPRFLTFEGSLFGCLKNAQGVPVAVEVSLAANENSVVWDRAHDCFRYDCLCDGRHVHLLEGALGSEPQVSAMVERLRDPQCPAELQLAKSSLAHLPRGDVPPLSELAHAGEAPADRAVMAAGAGAGPRVQAPADVDMLAQVRVCLYVS